MSSTTLLKTRRTLVAAGTSNAANATTRAAIDLRTAQGGRLTFKITNGAVGPSTQAVCSILTAHDEGPTPETGAAGAVWKTEWSFGGGTNNNGVTEQFYDVPQGVMHLEVEFSGNTGQAVTCEALFSEITAAVTT